MADYNFSVTDCPFSTEWIIEAVATDASEVRVYMRHRHSQARYWLAELVRGVSDIDARFLAKRAWSLYVRNSNEPTTVEKDMFLKDDIWNQITKEAKRLLEIGSVLLV